MINNWKIIYYENSENESELLEYIFSLKEREQAKIFSWISILEENGPNLTRPYSDLLRDGIHELRIKLSGKNIRILYFFCYKEFIVLTNKFEKNQKKVPEKEIKKAIDIRNIFLNKHDTYKKLLEVYNENS